MCFVGAKRGRKVRHFKVEDYFVGLNTYETRNTRIFEYKYNHKRRNVGEQHRH